MRWSITGTAMSPVERCSAIAATVASGSKRRRTTSVEPIESDIVENARPSEWNIGAVTTLPSLTLNGSRSKSAPAVISPRGGLRGAPLGVPVVPLVSSTTPPERRARPRAREASLVADDVLQRRVVVGRSLWVLDPRPVAQHATVGAFEQAGELLVVDQRLRTLALHDVDQLGPGERGVQVDGRAAELGVRRHGVEEAAVVAAHDGHAVTRPQAGRAPGVGDGVGAQVQLVEGQRAELVHQPGPLAEAHGGDRRHRADRPTPPDLARDLQRRVGLDRRDQARAGDRAQGLQVVGHGFEHHATPASGRLS